jgi:hypothetical protein
VHLIRVLAAAAAMVTAVAIGPAAMASGTPDQPATAQLVRGGSGIHGGGGGHGFGGFAERGGYAWHGGRGYRMRYGYLGGFYPYGYGCPYPSWRFGTDVCSPFAG